MSTARASLVVDQHQQGAARPDQSHCEALEVDAALKLEHSQVQKMPQQPLLLVQEAEAAAAVGRHLQGRPHLAWQVRFAEPVVVLAS